MTAETVQDVLRDMRRIAAIQPQEFADRIERALAMEAEPAAYERRWSADGVTPMRMPKAERPIGWRLQEVTKHKLMGDDVPLHRFSHPAIGNKPAVDLWAHIDTIREAVWDAWAEAKDKADLYKGYQRGRMHCEWQEKYSALLTLIDSAQDEKGE